MNIFVLHLNQNQAAKWHVDKHVVKMLLETVQLLYTVHWVKAYPELIKYTSPISLAKYHKTLDIPESMSTAPSTKSNSNSRGYKPSHINHPCAKWARETIGNYKWLATLGLELAVEYTYRYNKQHSCEGHIVWLYQNLPENIYCPFRTRFAIAMDSQYKVSEDPVECYRNYYKTSKKERGLIKYTKRSIPNWLEV
jgi:hypothetical protein